MTIQSESREFFLRDKAINIGSTKDREIGFPVTNKVKRLLLEGGKFIERYMDVGNRFLEGHVPSPDVWSKLLHSIVFKDDVLDNQLDIDAINASILALQQVSALTASNLNKLNTLDVSFSSPLINLLHDHSILHSSYETRFATDELVIGDFTITETRGTGIELSYLKNEGGANVKIVALTIDKLGNIIFPNTSNVVITGSLIVNGTFTNTI